MASLKCIGGKCDGQTAVVSDYSYRQGDAVRVQVFPKLAESQLINYEHVDSMLIDYEIYIIDVLRYNHKGPATAGFNRSEVWFLRPENFTTFDAIQFQFLKGVNE